jgi:signal transduction histidine kinase/CheY-like chemotaxis protein
MVDDAEANLLALESILGELGEVLVRARSGEAALAALLEQEFALVLLDVRMPDMDGFEVARLVRQQRRLKDLLIVFISAFTPEARDLERAYELGAVDFMVKPVNAGALRAKVRVFLELYRSRTDLSRRVAERTAELEKEVAERRLTEAALLESQDLVRNSLGAARMFAWELNLATGKAHVSEGIAPVIGAPRDFPESRAWENVHPEDVGEIRALVDKAVAEAGMFMRRLRYRRFDTGEWIWLEARGQGLRDVDGKVRRVVGLAIDVTERERVERALRARTEEVIAIMESAPAIIWVAQDPEGRSIVGNRASYEVLRMKPGLNASVTATDGGAPTHFRIYENGKLLAPDEYAIQRSLREGRDLRNYEERIVYEDGSFVDLLGNVVPLRNSDGSVRGAVAAFVDVTHLKAAEAEIRALNASLEEKVRERTARMSEALRELENVSYTIAHDLRSPLRAMRGFSEILLEDVGSRLGVEARNAAIRIAEGTLRMDELTRDLLEYARVAQAPAALEPLDLDVVAAEVLSGLEEEVRSCSASVEVVRPLGRALANRTLVSRALGNLLSNACKFVEPGQKPHVVVGTGKDGGKVTLWVRDRGIGIDPPRQSKLFGMFERLEPGRFPGTGIGLAIVRKAAERMGGRAGVESELGKGSRFWIELQSPEES